MDRKSWVMASSASSAAVVWNRSVSVGRSDLEASEDDDSDEGERECEHHGVLLSAAGSRPCDCFRTFFIARRGPPDRALRIGLCFRPLEPRMPLRVNPGPRPPIDDNRIGPTRLAA